MMTRSWAPVRERATGRYLASRSGRDRSSKTKTDTKWSLILAILHHTRDILFLTDDHLGVLSAEGSE